MDSRAAWDAENRNAMAVITAAVTALERKVAAASHAGSSPSP
jgi:hypothetical protein